MEEEPIKICLIGVSEHMVEHLIPSIKIVEGLDIHAVVSRNEKKRNALASKHKAQGFESWVAALSESGSEAVFVAGPPELNFKVIQQCIQQRLPVFAEKPWTCHGLVPCP